MHCLGKVKVLNTFYTVYTYNDYKEINKRSVAWDKQYDISYDETKATGVSGYCLVPVKEIHIYDGFSNDYNMNTLRHELLHALLYEIGYTNWQDEKLIEQISTWYPLMDDLFNQGRMLIENARVKKELRSKEDSKESLSRSE